MVAKRTSRMSSVFIRAGLSRAASASSETVSPCPLASEINPFMRSLVPSARLDGRRRGLYVLTSDGTEVLDKVLFIRAGVRVQSQKD